MADYHQIWDNWDYWDEEAELDAEMDARMGVERRRRRIVTDRMNPFVAMTDEEFVDRFRLKKDSVRDLAEELQDQLSAATDLRGCPVPPYLQLLIALRCMATGGHQVTIGDCHDVSQATVSNCLKTVSRAIASRSQHYIAPPAGNDLRRTVQQFYEIAGMPGVVGSIDCTHIAIQRPPVQNSELFRCRKGYFSLNVQAVCGPDLRFHNVVARWPGSVHDSRIFENSRLCGDLEDNLHPGYHLLGDSGYPLRPYLLTPLASPSNAQEEAYNLSHARTRNTVERAFGVLKRRFGYLGKKVRTELETTKAIIVASVVLHNIAVETRVVLPGEGDLEGNVHYPVHPNVAPVQPMHGNVQARLKRQQIIRDNF